ncbi:MAG: hypothetical protein IAG10_27305 [Planctomycetaceae bacterium]|nr:hypothetical protein [Planctomycetaceae bacterium]
MWPESAYRFNLSDRDVAQADDHFAEGVLYAVGRRDFSVPGFAFIDCGTAINSLLLRRRMVDLKEALGRVEQRLFGRTLGYLSVARFDQQNTTKFHVDGAPDEAMLMLGYEPTPVRSRVALADYTRCARDLGMTPIEFLDRLNPMFQSGEQALRPYVTELPFDQKRLQIILINNSRMPFTDGGSGWLGVMHTAQILTPDQSLHRVINSTMIAPQPIEELETVSLADKEWFLTTDEVRTSKY